jgi:hypothetical protein
MLVMPQRDISLPGSMCYPPASRGARWALDGLCLVLFRSRLKFTHSVAMDFTTAMKVYFYVVLLCLVDGDDCDSSVLISRTAVLGCKVGQVML